MNAETASATPMMKQYHKIKQEHPDSMLFFRLGDFYEMFFDDAQKASGILNIALTAREAGPGRKAPMCGIPYHAADAYIARLLSAGFKVAICEQVEDPKQAKGIVKREVVRTITPGTVVEAGVVADKRNHYLASVARSDNRYGLSWVDVTTGEFRVTELDNLAEVVKELTLYSPRECLIPREMTGEDGAGPVLSSELKGMMVTPLEDWKYDFQTGLSLLCGHFHTQSLDGFGCADMSAGVIAAGIALDYVKDTLGNAAQHISRLVSYQRGETLVLDRFTIRNLELIEGLQPREMKGTLLWVLDHTRTSMGSRMLQRWITHPLIQLDEIRKRQDAVESLMRLGTDLEKLRISLGEIRDIERLVSRLHCGVANARDLVALRLSLEALPALKSQLTGFESSLVKECAEGLAELPDLAGLIARSIVDEPPLSVRDGGLIREGFDAGLDELRGISKNGRAWIAQLQKKEIERTGIKSLKVGYNRVFGYYIEVSNPNLAQVPPDYVRKQTMSQAERFVTQDLKAWEEKILGAQAKSEEAEYEIFLKIRDEIKVRTVELQKIARSVACLDVLGSLALVALKNDYARPDVNDGDLIRIEEGRHPVVEQIVREERFVPNDTLLDNFENQILVLTGPNMAGKSTYLRQVALIVLMAQMGSFVPAKNAVIGLVDQIFTRIGASDALTRGQSTFMVEMNETANILHHATSRSLVILDEIGRGTSTFDGISIAWALIEYLYHNAGVKARTLFATHYHELTDLELTLPGVKNYNVLVREWNDRIVFVRKIARGGADKSYGIHVARLAGMPKAVIERAKDILSCLEDAGVESVKISQSSPFQQPQDRGAQGPHQLSLFEARRSFIEALQAINLDRLTPIDALLALKELKERFSEEE